MTDKPLVPARGDRPRCWVSPLTSLVRESSATVVSAARACNAWQTSWTCIGR